MKRALYIGLLFLISLFSCSPKQQQLTEQERTLIFQEKYASIPKVSIQSPDNVLIYCQYFEESGLPQLIFLRKEKSNWKEISRLTPDESYYNTIDSMQVIILDKTPYLYYEGYMMGGSMGNYSLTFVLYDYNTDKTYSLFYEYYPEGSLSHTEFTKSDNLQNNLAISNFLEEKGYTSSRIYKRNKMEDLVWNFFHENKTELASLFVLPDEWVKLRPIETDTKLVDINNLQEVSIVENEQFIVHSYFKGPVCAYNKSNRKYRLVWALTYRYEWVEKLQFDSSGYLTMYKVGSEFPDYLVDLPNSAYMVISRQEAVGDTLAAEEQAITGGEIYPIDN